MSNLERHGALLTLEPALAALRAVSEPTRLRILTLLAGGELSVSDLTDILNQSQPRISRHLKLLVESGLIERHREGAWAFFHLADRTGAADLLRSILAAVDRDDPQLAEDRERLTAVRGQRAAAAEAYFAKVAPSWDGVRSLHVSDEAVESAILAALGSAPVGTLLDLGTGTGRILRLLGSRADRAVGLDASHAMLSVARANLERAGLATAELRQGDIHAPPFRPASFDLVVVHQVLHYLDDPARAIASAARLVAPGGRILLVDFAAHDLEFLREKEAHRRLGFSRDQVSDWLAQSGLTPTLSRDLPPPKGSGRITVSLWLAQDRRSAADRPIAATRKEVA